MRTLLMNLWSVSYMTMLDIHLDALNSGGTIYHEFLARYKKIDNKVVYGIVEGKEDPMFYRGLIERHLPHGWEVELIKSGNKETVLKTIDVFDWSRFSHKRICFFVDRDLSSFLNEESQEIDNLYITDFYSIENELANFGTLKRVLEEVLNITQLNIHEAEKLQHQFELNLNLFQSALSSVMAQIVWWRKNGCKPCLGNISPKDFFSFKDGSIRLKSEFEDNLDRVKYAASRVNLAPISEADLAQSEVEFLDKQGPKRFVRGKYVLWFFVECAVQLHSAICKFCESYTAPPKVKLTLGMGNAMTIIAPRLRCPESLSNFLDRNYGQFIRDMSINNGKQ